MSEITENRENLVEFNESLGWIMRFESLRATIRTEKAMTMKECHVGF